MAKDPVAIVQIGMDIAKFAASAYKALKDGKISADEFDELAAIIEVIKFNISKLIK